MNKQIEHAAHQMMSFITAKWISRPICVVTQLGIPDLLSDRPLNINDIAEQCNAYAPYLYRVMRALASVGIFSETGERCFEHTPLSLSLQENAMRPIVLMMLADWHDKAWSRLLHSVQTGSIAFNEAHGKPCFEWLEENPDAAEQFNKANSLKARNSHAKVLDCISFAESERIIDVGGGYGGLMFAILHAYPEVRGEIADKPDVIARTMEIIQGQGLEKQCTVTGCDMFREIPGGYDVYILSHILHDWDDKHAQSILKNCFAAMQEGAKLLIIEMIVPSADMPSMAKLLDLEVLVMGGGCERTQAEFARLLGDSGFLIKNFFPCDDELHVIECVKDK